MRIIAIGFLAAASLTIMGAGSPNVKYREGQVWEYQTRPVDKGSLLRIQKIELIHIANKDEAVYHVSVIGLRLPGAPEAGGELQHIPVSEAALDASVTRLAPTNGAFPDPTAGIAEWRKANGGVFTIPVADIVASIEKMLTQREPTHIGS